MLALAQRLGMSKETLYAWFGNKATLLTELIEINRGAVHLAETGDIGSTLRRHGRDAVVKALAALLRRAKACGLLRSAGPIEAEVLAALALRDWQIERLLGRLSQPSAQRVAARSRETVELFLRLYATR